ncbi:hypothetical protein G9F32_07730 [Acinetobacter sp. 194]|uniref:hypothetical protein n=1 Tax=Acinetobacter shaoyimingii TaxID=2715164 RepID=UPI0014082B46|nr:hypothetical protein [Acinetobacter shaoyimingii]NHB57918.1 hypothetical protein [Acinetobacter shaoyimingii]
MSKRQMIIYLLTMPLLSAVLYFVGQEILLSDPWIAYILIISSILFMILMLYSILFLFRHGLPYVEISAHTIQSRAFLKNKIIEIKNIEETGFIIQKLNRFMSAMDLVIYQTSDTTKITLNGHPIRNEIKLPLSFLSVESRFDALNFLSFIYYTDEAKRESLINEYNQTLNFEFERYLDPKLVTLVNHLGFLTIMPQHELEETFNLIEQNLENTPPFD